MLGEKLGPYTIDRELGSGGMGRVYAATLSREAAGLTSGTTVALKVVHPHLLETEGFFKRFLREAQIGRSVVHANVVRTLDCDQLVAGGKAHAYLVMEYVEGQTLHELLDELERVPEELCRHVAREICKGLAAIHAAGVVHRDLKPENVLITPDHVVKVMDLGVARLADEAIRLSQTGAFVGSVEYAAPEQFGGDVDHRCDLYALGILLYELACGQHPYRGDDFRSVMKQICASEPRRAGEINPQLSPYFEELVHTLLARDREERFASTEDLVAVLDEAEASQWWRERARVLRATTRRPLRRISIPRETAVYGREKELDRLLGLFATARTGDGQVVLIEGEAGIGKSRLVDELVTRLHADGEAVNFLFGSYPPGGAATASGAFSTAYREHLGDAGSAAYLTWSPVLVPAFDALLRGETAPSGVERLTHDSLQTCFVRVTRALAEESVTIVLIDDLHFAPDEGRGLFTSLAMAAPGSRLLLIGSLRPGVSEEWVSGLTRLDHTSHIPLDRLGPKDLAALLQDSFGSERLAVALAGQIGIKSDGNPFFAFEIIRGLREGQFISQREDGSWVSTGVIDEIRIPSSVLDLVKARVADLSDEERDLLDVASCWGYEFDPVLIGAVVGLARIPVLKRCARIERKQRLVRSVGRHYVFDHHQVQEALHGALNEQLREEYHAALAEALETREGAIDADPAELDRALCVDLCEHYLAGGRGRAAVRYLDAAHAHLTDAYLFAQDAALLETALAHAGSLSGLTRVEALLRLGLTADRLGRYELRAECAREAERTAAAEHDATWRAKASVHVGAALLSLGDFEQSREILERAVQIADELGEQLVLAEARGTLGNTLFHLGCLDRALAEHRQCETLKREAGDRVGEAGAIQNAGQVLQAMSRLDEARADYERGLAVSREVGDRQGQATGLVNLGAVHTFAGRLTEALDCARQGLAVYREIGIRPGEAVATHSLALTLQYLGRFAEAWECAEQGRDLYREIGGRVGEASSLGTLGTLSGQLGRANEARELHEQCLALAREIGHRSLQATCRINLGYSAVAEGRLVDAQEHLERGRELFREMGVRGNEAVALVNLGTLHVNRGDHERARANLDECLDVAREAGARYPEGYALAALARLADDQGEPAEAKRFAQEALDLRREIDHGDGIADSLLVLGDLYRREGDDGAARSALEESLALHRDQGRQSGIVASLALLACLPGGAADEAESALAEFGDAAATRETRLLLWRATGNPAHLVAAKEQLDELLAKNPTELHESMCRNNRVDREILAAWREKFGDGV